MSLLDRNRHTVYVTPRERVDDGYGSYKYRDLPEVAVPGNCSVQSATEQETMGLQGSVTFNFTTRHPWPWSMVSVVRWDGPNGRWPGRMWDQEGEARVYDSSPRVAHTNVVLKARTSKDGENTG